MNLFFNSRLRCMYSSEENPINQVYYDSTCNQLVVEATDRRIIDFKKFMNYCVVDHISIRPDIKYIITSCKEGVFIQNICDQYIYLLSPKWKNIYTYPKNTICISNDNKRYLMIKYGKLYSNEIDKNKELFMKNINSSNKFTITWNHNSNFIALCEIMCDICIFNTRNGNIVHVLENTSNSFCCSFNFNSNYIFVGYKKCVVVFNSSTCKVYSTNRFKGIMRKKFFMSCIDNRYIACVETNDGIFLKLYNIHGLELFNCEIKSLIKYGSWSKDSSKLAISFIDKLDRNDISIYEVGIEHISILYTFQSCLSIKSLCWSLDNADLYYICSNTELHEAKLVKFHYGKMNDYIDNILSKPNLVFLDELQYHPLLIRHHKDVQESLKYFRDGIF